MGAALKFRQERLARQSGEIARLKVVQGPDLGTVYVITGYRVVIGRGEECDIMLSDLRASRKHAELHYGAGGWSVADAGSANGISLNGQGMGGGEARAIRTKDTVALGETILEFTSAEAGTVVLMSQAATPDQIRQEQSELAAQRAKIQAMGKMGGLAKNLPRPDQLGPARARLIPKGSPLGKPQGLEPKKLLLIAAVLIGGYFFIMDNPPGAPKKQVAKKDDADTNFRDLASYLPPAESSAIERTADVFFKSGFREYTEGNYLRARVQFENVLQMAPGHPLAKLYLSNANQRIEEEVKEHLELGRKDFEAGKYKMSRGHYEAIQRLMFRDPQNPAYVESTDQLKRIVDKTSGGTG